MYIEKIIFKPAEEKIDRQVYRTPRTVPYCTRQVKTLNLDIPPLGLASIQPNNIKLKPIPTSVNQKNTVFNKTKNINTTLTLNNNLSPLNNSSPKEITELEAILETIISKLPESKNTPETNSSSVKKVEAIVYQTDSKKIHQSEITESKGTDRSVTELNTDNNFVELEDISKRSIWLFKQLTESGDTSNISSFKVKNLTESEELNVNKNTDIITCPSEKLRELKSNSETTLGRSNNLIDLEENLYLPKNHSDSHMANESNDSLEETSNDSLYLSINKNINKENTPELNVYEPNESDDIPDIAFLSKKRAELEVILEEINVPSFNNSRESELVNFSKSIMESQLKLEEYIAQLRTSESEQKRGIPISSHTELEENEIKTCPSTNVIESESTLNSKVGKSTSTSPCQIPCLTSSSAKGLINFHQSKSSKHAKSEKKVQGDFISDLYQMEVILKNILMKRKPDPHYWQPTCSSKLKENEPKVYGIPPSFIQTIHKFIENKKSIQR